MSARERAVACCCIAQDATSRRRITEHPKPTRDVEALSLVLDVLDRDAEVAPLAQNGGASIWNGAPGSVTTYSAEPTCPRASPVTASQARSDCQ